MQIIIKTKHLELTPKIENYVEGKIGHLQKFEDQIMDTNVKLTSGKEHSSETKFRVEVTMHLPKTLFRAESKAQDVYAAIDFVSEKLERQLEKYKNKMFGKGNK
jgi:putative sigma-54 modulation protein